MTVKDNSEERPYFGFMPKPTRLPKVDGKDKKNIFNADYIEI